jgi:hypothetical protein
MTNKGKNNHQKQKNYTNPNLSKFVQKWPNTRSQCTKGTILFLSTKIHVPRTLETTWPSLSPLKAIICYVSIN